MVMTLAALGFVPSSAATNTCVNGVEFSAAQPGMRYNRNAGVLKVYRGVADTTGNAMGVDGCVFFCANHADCAFATFDGAGGGICKLFPSASTLKVWEDQLMVSVEKTGSPCIEAPPQKPEEQPADGPLQQTEGSEEDTSRETHVSYTPTSATSAKTCAELGWAKVVEGVCAESKFPATGYEADGITKECYNGRKFAGASKMCEVIGARLCTKAEAVNKVPEGTGCNQDKDWMWTSTPCGLGLDGTKYELVKVSKGAVACRNPNKVKAVRCCADVDGK